MAWGRLERGVRSVSTSFTVFALLGVSAASAVQWDWPTLVERFEAARTMASASTLPPDGVAPNAAPNGTAPTRVFAVAETTAPPIRHVSGALCGDPRLEGESLGGLADQVSEDDPRYCGAEEAIQLSKVAGVTVAPAAVTTCALAGRLADWIERDVAPAASATLGRDLVGVRQISAYACRTRNRQPGARMSEHAFANALDIASFHFADSGEAVTVLADWDIGEDASQEAVFLQQVWRSACGRFGTVLGPLADAFHENHFHVDGAQRTRAYCR